MERLPQDTHRIVLFWSGGKDSALALHEIAINPRYQDYRVESLFTTFTEVYDRVTGHGVRRALIEVQAECLGLDLLKSYIPRRARMSQYEAATAEVLHERRNGGTLFAASGDLFIEKQRLALWRSVGLKGCCPLWTRHSRRHAEEVIRLGFKAIVVCVDGRALDASFVGRPVDGDFLRDLPTGIDPCGENGEYHTFVFDGPIFRRPIPCRLGEVVHREGFHFCDLLLEEGAEPTIERR